MLSVEVQEVVLGSDREIVIRLYDDIQGDLHGYALAVTHDSAAAEDLVQESFLRLLRQHRAGNPPTDPRAWLFRVCTNLIRSSFRRRSVAERNAPRLRSGDLAESAETTAIRSVGQQDVRRALEALPEEVRMAMMLSAEGFTGREIAATLRRSEGATRTLLWRGRLELRRQLGTEPDR